MKVEDGGLGVTSPALPRAPLRAQRGAGEGRVREWAGP